MDQWSRLHLEVEREGAVERQEGEEVEVETPPALGSLYSRAVAEASIARDGTLLAAAILKGGSGYTR